MNDITGMPELDITYTSETKKKVRRVKKIPEVLNHEEFKTLLKHTKLKHHRLAFKLAYYAGLRIGEVVNLQREDIKFDNKLIMIRRRKTVKAISGKGGKERPVPLPKFIRSSEWNCLPFKCGVRNFEISFKTKCNKHLGRDLHFHTLRHSFATDCINGGMPPNQVQQLMGHARLTTTMIYVHMNPKLALETYDKMWADKK